MNPNESANAPAAVGLDIDTGLFESQLIEESPDESVRSGGGGAPPRRRRSQTPVLFWICLFWIVLVILTAIFASILPLASYTTPVGDPGMAPGLRREFLGTDVLGRSILSRVSFGARVSLTVGTIATSVGLLIGSTIGILSAYFKGVIGGIVDILSNTLLSIPPLIFLLAIAAALKPSLQTLVISLAVLTIPTFARLTKANTIALLEREYVLAARAMGARNRRIILRDLLPNVVPPLLSYAVIVTAALIVAEGSLSFLGLGIPPPNPSWGEMIADGQGSLATYPWVVFTPCLAMFFTVFSLNVLGDRLQRRFSVRESML